jgi:acyl carrier protein
MERTQIIEGLKDILRTYVEDPAVIENLQEEADLIDDLDINSAHLIDVVLEAETAFGVEIDNNSIEKIDTVKSCIDIIISKLPDEVSR